MHILTRGEYNKSTPKEKAEIGKRASEHGIASTIRHLTKKYSNLKESSVQTWKNIYLAELRRRRACQQSLSYLKRRGDRYYWAIN